MRAIYRVAIATFHEAWRRKLMNTILVFAILIIGCSWVFAYLQPGAELKMIIDVSLGSIRFFGLLIAVYHNLIYYGAIPEKLRPCTIEASCSTKYIELFGFLSIPTMSLLGFIAVLTCFLVYRRLVAKKA